MVGNTQGFTLLPVFGPLWSQVSGDSLVAALTTRQSDGGRLQALQLPGTGVHSPRCAPTPALARSQARRPSNHLHGSRTIFSGKQEAI